MAELFDVRAFIEERDGDFPPFEFVGLDGETYELPNVETLTERQVERISVNGELKEVLGELAPDALDEIAGMPVYASQKLAELWLSGAGESGKSPAPSRRTGGSGKRSKPTSPSEE